jgi:hypothetical protein
MFLEPTRHPKRLKEADSFNEAVRTAEDMYEGVTKSFRTGRLER